MSNTASIPNLTPRILISVLLVWMVILSSQWLEDNARQAEMINVQKINLTQQQAELASRLSQNILQLQSGHYKHDQIILRLVSAITDLKYLQYQQKQLADVSQQHSNRIITNSHADNTQSKFSFNEIVRLFEELTHGIETNDSNGEMINNVSAQLFDSLQNMIVESHYQINDLTSQLHQQIGKHKQTAWWLTFATMILVFVISLSIYLNSKKVVSYQFNLLKQNAEQLKAKTIRIQENEQRLVLESEQRSQQQNKLESILNSAVDAIITITGDGIIDSFNPSAVSMFGYSAESVIGKNIKMLMPEPYSSEHDGYLAHYHKTGEKRVIGHIREVVGRRIDGSEFPLRLSVSEVLGVEPKLYSGIIRDITDRKKMEAKLQNTLTELTQKQAEIEEEERIARHVFENITSSNNDTIAEVSSWCEPMGTFSGDMVLSAILPSKGIRIILCDFTGHGLPAALGAVPVSTIHSAMAKKGLPLEVLMNELNDKLNDLLPTGIFCCIAGIDLDDTRTQAQIWNAGLPDVLVVNDSGEIIQRISSDHLPVGVTTYSKSELHCHTINLNKGDTIYALSDGLTEAENESGELFGQQRFEQLLMSVIDEHGRLDHIRNSVGKFIGNAAATDDISLIEIKTVSTTS